MTTDDPEPPLACAEFSFSLDDLVDVAERFLRRSRVHARLRLQATFAAALLGGVSMFALLSMSPTSSRTVNALLGAGTALVGFGVLHVRFERLHARRLRRYLHELHGDGPHPCRVELHRDRVRAAQLGTTTEWPWDQVHGVTATGDDIELQTSAGCTVVRARAFASPEARARFLATAQRLLRQHAAPVTAGSG
ncbi:MAG TPA: hypothetical protein VFZ65_16850 [Planctomycetota bacterium]|nr:hypothetical protein [Planctomycetota bacterium]